MITCYDAEYKATKLIRQGKAKLNPHFSELAEWIGSTWGVTVVNIIYDQLSSPIKQPRLMIVLEHHDEKEKFCDECNFDPVKQQAIANKFAELVSRKSLHAYGVVDLLVVFSAFAPVAKQEANCLITDADILNLLKRISDPNLWTIHRCFGRAVFMFFTDQQMRSCKRILLRSYEDQYFDLLQRYDEFQYLDRDGFSLEFDSKENFDRNYKGVWFLYDR